VAVRQHVRFFALSFVESVLLSDFSINQSFRFVVEAFPNGGFESIRRYICELAAAHVAPALNPAWQIQFVNGG
jgi:hypothetical protein